MPKRNSRRNRNLDLWCPNFFKINYGDNVPAANGTFTASHIVAFNTEESGTTFPRKVRIRNVDLTANLETMATTSSAFDNVTVAFMKIPQGFSVDNTSDATLVKHPEWVLAYKYIGSPVVTSESQQYQPIRIRSNKSITLYPGDGLYLVVTGTKAATQSVATIYTNGLVKYFTRVN
jgi:hypothetical protein